MKTSRSSPSTTTPSISPIWRTLESDARTGAAIAVAKVPPRTTPPRSFWSARATPIDAIDQYRQALVFAPDNVGLLLNLAVLYLRESQFTAALDPLEHARRVAPDSRGATSRS